MVWIIAATIGVLVLILIAMNLFLNNEEPILHTTTIEADVLSINDRILKGEMIGGFLSGSDGWIDGSKCVVGVRFEWAGKLWLEDYGFKNAELGYFAGKKTIPLTIKWNKDTSSQYAEIKIYLLDRLILEARTSEYGGKYKVKESVWDWIQKNG